MSTSREDLEAAFAASTNDQSSTAPAPRDAPPDPTPGDPPGDPAAAPPAPAPGDDDPATVAGAVRDAAGRFTKKPGSAQPPVEDDNKAPLPKAPENHAPDPNGGENTGIKLDPSKPPSSWSPAMREKWPEIPEDIRNEVIRREEASAQGVAKIQQYYQQFEPLHKTVGQFGNYFQHIQADPAQHVQQALETELNLRMGNPAQKMTLLLNLADTYGVPLRKTLDAALNGGLDSMLEESHKQHKTPIALPPQVQQELQEMRQWRQEITNQAVEAEYTAFVNNPANKFHADVAERMATLLESGVAEGYQDAYDMACWADPKIRPLLIAQQNGQAQQDALRTRQQQAAAVVPPTQTPLAVAPGVDETDDLHATLAKNWNNAARG